jgi:hypothetical protein
VGDGSGDQIRGVGAVGRRVAVTITSDRRRSRGVGGVDGVGGGGGEAAALRGRTTGHALGRP